MPSLAQRTQPIDDSRYARVNPLQIPPPPIQSTLEPGQKSVVNMRCPVPPVSFTPDTSRQFYRGSSIPQYRFIAPPQLSGNVNSSGGSSSTSTVVNNSTTNVTSLPKAQIASVSTPVLNPSIPYTTSVSLAKTFGLLQIAVTAACRVQLYSTSAFQSADIGRAAFVSGSPNPPPPGTENGLIVDVYFTDTPDSWVFSPTWSGSNADFPQTSLIYVTITNTAASSNAITASITYLQQEQ